MIKKESKSPLDDMPRNNGMTVPDGYFEGFKSRMMAQLPEMPEEEEMTPRRTLWQRAKPYVYLAAMFAGAYLMLNMFSISQKIRGTVDSMPQASQTELLAEVVNSNTLAYVDDYIYMNSYDLYDDLYESGFDIPES